VRPLRGSLSSSRNFFCGFCARQSDLIR